jgi:predicted SprT family Zn-dependent metalloprotease
MSLIDPTDQSYSAIRDAYLYFNRALFQGKLPTCLITFQRQRRIMGYVSFKRWFNASREYVDELAINPEYFANYPLIEICQTLCHEMVHIWQAHFGHPGRRNYHNAEWARKMKSIGLHPSSTGRPGGETTGEKVGDYIVHEGPFHRACQTLLQEGFMLRWVDRFPVHRGNEPIGIYDEKGNPVDVTDELVAMTPLAQTRSFRKESPPHASVRIDGLDIAGDYSEVSEQDENDLSIPFAQPFALQIADDDLPRDSQPLNRSNRHKYVCKSCGMQVWGKPALHVICGTCSLNLTEYS